MAAALQSHPAAFESGQPDADRLQEDVSFNHKTGSRFPGISGPKKSGRSGACAEVSAADQLIRRGADPSIIRFAVAVRPKTVIDAGGKITQESIVPVCANCEATWPK